MQATAPASIQLPWASDQQSLGDEQQRDGAADRIGR
jgi:hypothetical protein